MNHMTHFAYEAMFTNFDWNEQPGYAHQHLLKSATPVSADKKSAPDDDVPSPSPRSCLTCASEIEAGAETVIVDNTIHSVGFSGHPVGESP